MRVASWRGGRQARINASRLAQLYGALDTPLAWCLGRPPLQPRLIMSLLGEITRWHENGMVGPGDIKVWWGARAKGMKDIAVEMRGDGCEALGWEKLIWIMQWASRHGAHFSRCDTDFDNYSRSVSPEDVRAACKGTDRLLVSHARKGGLYIEDNFGTDCEDGHGYRIGSGSGRRFLRVYDKGEESKGEKNCIRWEEQHCDAPRAKSTVATWVRAIWPSSWRISRSTMPPCPNGACASWVPRRPSSRMGRS